MTGKKKKKNSSIYVSIIPFPNICGLTNKLTRKIMSETQEWWRMGSPGRERERERERGICGWY